jgi:hypothetical protein
MVARRKSVDYDPTFNSSVHMNSGNTVTVACKLPNGLKLQICQKKTEKEQTPNGVRDIEVWRPTGEEIEVKGPRVAFGALPSYPIIGGYALTQNVDKRFWEKWLEQNADSDLIKNHLLHAYPTPQAAQSFAKEHEEVRSGFEPIDPDNLPRGLRHPNIKLERLDDK